VSETSSGPFLQQSDPRSRLWWKGQHSHRCGSKQPTTPCSASVIAWWVRNPSKVQELLLSLSADFLFAPGTDNSVPVAAPVCRKGNRLLTFLEPRSAELWAGVRN